MCIHRQLDLRWLIYFVTPGGFDFFQRLNSLIIFHSQELSMWETCKEENKKSTSITFFFVTTVLVVHKWSSQEPLQRAEFAAHYLMSCFFLKRTFTFFLMYIVRKKRKSTKIWHFSKILFKIRSDIWAHKHLQGCFLHFISSSYALLHLQCQRISYVCSLRPKNICKSRAAGWKIFEVIAMFLLLQSYNFNL